MEQQLKISPKDLIIIITTSPVQSNPSCGIIDSAILSIKQQPTLEDIPITIICDGVKTTEDKGSKFKSGIVSQQALQNYEQYKVNLKQKYSQDPQITIIQRTERYCFAQNIRYVMAMCQQEYVLIFQHDHTFLRKMDLYSLVQTMKKHPINYIGFVNKSVETAPVELHQNLKLRAYFNQLTGYQPTEVRQTQGQYIGGILQHYKKVYGHPFLPLLFWYDKVHIARKSYYLEVIFNKKGFYNEMTKSYQKTISFVQDSFGTATRKAIRIQPQKFEEVRAYLLWDSPQAAIKHIHGRGWLTEEQKEEVIAKNLEQKGSESSSEEAVEEHDLNLDMFEQ